ncbi:MAG: spore protease YyaC [Defluviitaleaceae bacterium]|nr:spore protease YyaC [Defluviitaleaceae bacterium]
MKTLPARNRQTLYINSNRQDASTYFAEYLHELLHPCIHHERELVLLCIGTDRITGDSLGPIIGHNLAEMAGSRACPAHNFYIYGTLGSPVHAGNLSQVLDSIRTRHTNPVIIAVDASLGRPQSVGFVTIGIGALTPGAGVKKLLPKVGDIHVTGIVNASGSANFAALQNTQPATVVKLADIITNGFIRTLQHLYLD